MSSFWPHSPAHHFDEAGCYMVTAGTYHKAPWFAAPERRDLLLGSLFAVAHEFGWQLQAWAILTNHYHFIAFSPPEPSSLRSMLGKLHMTTAKEINRRDGTPGRKVWFQFWDSQITYERSFLARLNYVHHNPVHHGVVVVANQYPWCSAAWFEQNAQPPFLKTVLGFKTDQIHVKDDY